MVILTAPEAHFSKKMDAPTVIARLRENETVASKTKVLLRRGSSRAFQRYPVRPLIPIRTQFTLFPPDPLTRDSAQRLERRRSATAVNPRGTTPTPVISPSFTPHKILFYQKMQHLLGAGCTPSQLQPRLPTMPKSKSHRLRARAHS